MKELTPEELLDHVVAQSRDTVVLRDEESSLTVEQNNERETMMDDDIEAKKNMQKKFEEDLEDLEAKEAPTMQRGIRYDPPGAFALRPNHPAASVASTTAPPPIHAILVPDHNSSAETIDSIYTAEPLSLLKGDPFFRRKWNLALVCLCILGMFAVITVSVYLTIDNLKEDDKDSNRLNKPSHLLKHDDDEDDNDCTAHAVIFGTNVYDCGDSASHLELTFDCNHAKLELQQLASNVSCGETETGKTLCRIPMVDRITTSFVSFRCKNRSPSKPDDIAATAMLVVPSQQCQRGNSAVVKMVSLCENESFTSDATKCIDSRRIGTNVQGGCDAQCSDGCTLQALDHFVCSGASMEEDVTLVESVRTNVTNFLEWRRGS